MKVLLIDKKGFKKEIEIHENQVGSDIFIPVINKISLNYNSDSLDTPICERVRFTYYTKIDDNIVEYREEDDFSC